MRDNEKEGRNPHDARYARDSSHHATPVQAAREPFVPLTFAVLAPPLLWALHFAFLYLLEGFLCEAPHASAAVIPAAIIGATLIGASLCAWALFGGDTWLRGAGVSRVESIDFLRATQRVLAGLSLVAILWSGSGALMLGPCAFAY